jgi:hypothetical protein
LVNDRQSVEKVRAELDKHIPVFSARDRVLSEIVQTEGAGAVFAPENIFWNPESKHVAENWQALWHKSLDIGAAILAAGFQSERKWSPEEFWLEYNTLRKDIKTALFGLAPSATPAKYPSEDAAIADILKQLLAKCRREIRPTETPLTEEETETLILSGPPAQETEALAETVIQSPITPLEASLLSDHPPEGEETLILPAENPLNPQKPEAESPAEELIQETVILSPGSSAATPAPVDSINSDMGKEDLPETVVLSPGGRPEGRSDLVARTYRPDNQTNNYRQPAGEDSRPQRGTEKKDDPSQDDDILTETVILRPEKDKGAKNE